MQDLGPMLTSPVVRSTHLRFCLLLRGGIHPAGPPLSPAQLVPSLPALAALAFLPGALDQFWLPKVLVLLVGLPTVLAAALVRGEPALPDSRPRRFLIVLAVSATVLSVAAPLTTARNLELHLLGAAEAGLFLGLFLSAACLLRPGESGRAAPLALPAGAAAAVAVLAVLQAAGLDPVRWLLSLHSSRPGRWRILTTTGNPGWTAEFLAASFPLTAAWAWSRPRRLRRVLLPLQAVLFTAPVALTGSRTGLLALAAGAAVLVLSPPAEDRRRRRLRAAAAALAVTACGGVLAAAAGSARWAELRPLTGRAALWAAGARLAAVHPLLGSGLRHTGLLLPDGLRRVAGAVEPGADRLLPTTLVDRLDDDWLQLSLERGIPAAAVTLGVWALALALAWRTARREGSALHAGIAGGLAALGLCSLTSAPLHTPSTAILFWYLAGLAGGVTCSGPRSPRSSPARRRLWGAVTAAGAAGALVLAGLALNLDLAAGHGRKLARSGQAARAVAPLQRAVDAMPWLEGGAPELAEALLRSGKPEEALVVCVHAARWQASERVWAVQARALARLGEPAAARTLLASGLEVLPRSPLLHTVWNELFPAVPPLAGSAPGPAMVQP